MPTLMAGSAMLNRIVSVLLCLTKWTICVRQGRTGSSVRIGRLLYGIALMLLLGAVFPGLCRGDVVLFRTPHSQRSEEEALKKVADLYGLSIHTVDVRSPGVLGPAMSELKNSGTLAVLISEDALSALDRNKVQAALRRPNGLQVPILVFGVHSGDKTDELKSWSGGKIWDCSPLGPEYSPKALEVGNLPTLTRMLAGLELPAVVAPECRIEFRPHPTVQTVVSSSSENRAHEAAVLLVARSAVGEVFFVPQMRSVDTSWTGKVNALSKAFSSVAPYVLFLSYAAGSYGWHSDGHYANLTIDDPWLTEPYGHLDYHAMLAEMKKHNFHTTIAFIPWNFDRSEAGVAGLFRENPNFFSICIHGNNHAHREFGDYAKNPLAQQIADIQQSVARMERFQSLTGISYDRFMVFPHAVAPEQTLVALKKYGFSGTANSSNVPLGETLPSEPTFLLRPYTTAYGGFFSLSRYPVTEIVPRAEIAIQSFMGNPLLFYGHQNLFEGGAGAFNAHADLVNRAQPDARWTSLGEIARHSHLLRKRRDGGFDVLMLSSEMDLLNPTDEELTFYLQRKTDSGSDTSSLTVDGAPVSFTSSGGMSVFRLTIAAHQGRKVRSTYINDLDLSHTSVTKRSPYAYALRMFSDFRDLTLSRSSWGGALTRAYYGHNWDLLESYLERSWWVAVILVAGLTFMGIRSRRQSASDRNLRGTIRD